MVDAQKLSGDERFSTYGQLDVDISTEPAPWASRSNSNQLDLFSTRVGGITFHPVYAMIYNTLYIK